MAKKKKLEPIKMKIECIAWIDPDDVGFRRRLLDQICLKDDTDFLKLHELFGSNIGIQATVELDWRNGKKFQGVEVVPFYKTRGRSQ